MLRIKIRWRLIAWSVKDTESIDPKMVRTKTNRLVMQSKCSVCGIKSQDL